MVIESVAKVLYVSIAGKFGHAFGPSDVLFFGCEIRLSAIVSRAWRSMISCSQRTLLTRLFRMMH